MKLLNKLRKKQPTYTIEFCQKNLDRFLKEDEFSNYDLYLNSANIQYKEYECQSRCKECKKSPYAIIDGEFITADDSKKLLDEMKRMTNTK